MDMIMDVTKEDEISNSQSANKKLILGIWLRSKHTTCTSVLLLLLLLLWVHPEIIP